MIIISPTELRNEQKKYLDLAEKEKVIVKRGRKFIKLTVSNRIDEKENEIQEWLEDYLAIPEEFRCNPFTYSPSGDVYFADKRNIAAIERGFKDVEEGRVITISSKEELNKFFDRL